MNIFSIEMDDSKIRAIATVLGFANSFMTFVILQVLNRKIFARWRMSSWTTVVFLWAGIIPCIFELIIPININAIGFKNIGTKTGVVFWFIGIIMLIYLMAKILRADLIAFKKPEASFSKQEKFGIQSVDVLIEKARKEGKKFYFPVLLIGERASNPHHFAQRFLMTGIESGAASIYFTFTRPPEIIIAQLGRLGFCNETQGNQLVIVDCYNPLIKQGKSMKKRNYSNITVLSADPRNPHYVNKIYEQAIRIAINGNYTSLRVVYDSFSDFLLFADAELIITYLRHNVVWEERSGVQSLYILWPEALDKPLSDSYLIWFSNTPIWLRTKDKHLLLTIQSLFEEPRNFIVNYNYELVR